jgi:dienelactone hydrolase
VKKIIISMLLIVALLAGSLLFTPVRTFLIAATIPDYPDWPPPTLDLDPSDVGEIYYTTSSPYDLEVILGDMSQARRTTGLGYLSYPETASADSPVPAMIVVPGSGGITEGREHEYATWFNEQGIAAFVVEYYAPRGFDNNSNYIIRTSSVTEFDLISDAYAALKLLGTSELIDPARIGLIGFSYGGMATRLAMDSRIKRALAPDSPAFDLHIDVYGPCFQNLQSTELTDAPLLTLRGTEDASNELEACARREDEIRQLGTKVTAHIYEGVGHAWEATVPRFFSEKSPYLAGCELKYDAKGKATLNGQPLTDYGIDAPYSEKMASRFSSAGKFKECVGYGYIVGRDEEARSRGYADIEDFLGTTW